MIALLGCAAPPGDAPVVRVAAAASLAEVIPEIATALDVSIEPRFGASSTLARQIRDGAGSDVLVSADPRWVDDVIEAGLAVPGTRRVIATNGLVAIVPRDAGSTPHDAAALAALPHLAVAGADVPAGAHARTALERSGALAAAREHLVVAADVRAALAWVAQGEADGGIVYATDARAEPRVRVAFAFDPSSHEPIRYEAIALTPAGRALVSRLGDEPVRRVLAEAGFGPP